MARGDYAFGRPLFSCWLGLAGYRAAFIGKVERIAAATDVVVTAALRSRSPGLIPRVSDTRLYILPPDIWTLGRLFPIVFRRNRSTPAFNKKSVPAALF